MNIGREWAVLTEPVLLQIFKKLPTAQVLLCGLTCKRWQDISNDKLLWKHLLKRDFKLKNKGFTFSEEVGYDWKQEYIRLVDCAPKVLKQTLTGHSDEVLHVTFSHDGTQITSCSKDQQFIVWNFDEGTAQFSRHYSHDMGKYLWLHTWTAEYCPDDTKLMVAGVVNNVGGELAIFKTGKGSDEVYEYLCRVVNDPYDVLGCWMSNQFFISGTMSADFFADVEASIWLCEPPEQPDSVSQPAQSETVALPPQPLNLTCYKGLLFKFRNMEGTVYLRYVQSFSRKKFQKESKVWEQRSKSSRRTDLDPHNQDLEQVIDDEECNKIIAEEQICAVFLCGNKTTIPHQLGFQRLTPEGMRFPPSLEKAEKVIEFHGHVIGMKISPDQTKLYVNVRSWPENAYPTLEQPPPIANNIELYVIDLETFEITNEVLSGHCGFTASEKAFYLYLDISRDFVTSGSENSQGYIWDRKRGVILSKLNHSLCVNRVSLNPKNQEVAVSASDDQNLKVWISQRMNRNLPTYS